MQFTLLAAVVLAITGAQVQARPLTRSVTYMTYATDLYVDPWVVMQGQRAASTASETALVATQALPSPATAVSSSATGTATPLSSSAEGNTTALSSSAAATATALPSSLEADPSSSTQSESTSEEPASSTEEEQYYSIQTQNAE